MSDNVESPAADRIQGAANIARFLGISERQCRWRLERGLIPHGREGEAIVASKRALAEHWRKSTSAQSGKSAA